MQKEEKPSIFVTRRNQVQHYSFKKEDIVVEHTISRLKKVQEYRMKYLGTN
jgi:hypothetical protein